MESSEGDFGLLRYYQALKKYRPMILTVTLLSFAITTLVSFFVIAPAYEAKLVLLILRAGDAKQTGPVSDNFNLEEVISSVSKMPQFTMQSYVAQVQTDTVLQRVIDNMGLQEYNTTRLKNQVTVAMIKDTNLIEVKVVDSDPEFARDVANTLGNEFADYVTEMNIQKLTKSGHLLEQQANEEEKMLQKAMEDLNNFLAQPKNANVLDQEGKNLSELLTHYGNAKIQAEIDVQQLSAQIVELEKRIAETPQTVHRDRGALQRIEADSTQVEQINPVYTMLKTELTQKATQLAGKKAELKTLVASIAEIDAKWKSIQEEIAPKQTEYERLKREVERHTNTRNLLMEKVTEIRIARFINQGETTVKVASPAITPTTPFKPNKQKNMALGLLAGLVLSSFLAIALEFSSDMIKKRDCTG
ncbi:hypothetical protein GTO89_14540 [Heliobacterium gestii]|uniref:Tyrosine-protein kinase G-rich domain-containing protein n=1 Tax=Heliomicrobium gestii TaxID=2699 RepID=A0A845LI52_HELGE|nr:GNVR domain-containing protein [Heliomicrobium gestii]MBM7867983.1 capsular polysaccharide biosynthesis protein [Heliomicrobium gestii]MZP44249.1 hypothetical protein [Heliomicrobium gestii]